MMDMVNSPVLPPLFLCAVAVLVLARHEWQLRIRRARMPEPEIVRIADDLLARHGARAAEIAAINEDRAWRYGAPVEQGTWRRVREEVQFRLQS